MARKTRAVVRLTENFIASITPSQQRFEIWDEEVRGLTLRVTPAGKRSFYVLRRPHGGALERVYIGPWPETPLRVAREKALAVLQQLVGGRSVVAERRRLKGETTLGELWALYERHARGRKRSWSTDEGRWRKHLQPHAGVPLSKITTRTVTEWLARITATSGPGAANRVRALLSVLYNHARRHYGLELANPALAAPRHQENSRARVLRPGEIRALLDVCQARAGETAADWVLVALFTGARAGAINGLRWSEIDFEERVWHIPGERMKAGRPLSVPLCGTVMRVLQRRREAAISSEFVFPSATRRAGHVDTPREGFAALLEEASIAEHATPHDLRRTFATTAGEAGVGWGDIAALLGHSPVPGITHVYVRPSLAGLRRAVARLEAALLAAGRTGSGQLLAFPGTSDS
ncbi:MAG: tyrosine-type recombinase/integrase [Acidobacteriota bacterium]